MKEISPVKGNEDVVVNVVVLVTFTICTLTVLPVIPEEESVSAIHEQELVVQFCIVFVYKVELSDALIILTTASFIIPVVDANHKPASGFTVHALLGSDWLPPKAPLFVH